MPQLFGPLDNIVVETQQLRSKDGEQHPHQAKGSPHQSLSHLDSLTVLAIPSTLIQEHKRSNTMPIQPSTQLASW